MCLLLLLGCFKLSIISDYYNCCYSVYHPVMQSPFSMIPCQVMLLTIIPIIFVAVLLVHNNIGCLCQSVAAITHQQVKTGA